MAGDYASTAASPTGPGMRGRHRQRSKWLPSPSSGAAEASHPAPLPDSRAIRSNAAPATSRACSTSVGVWAALMNQL